MFWETAFDVVSLGFSIWEVVQNPKDPWAWAGLVGDAIDLLPIVTGVGETTRAIKAANKISEVADSVKDGAKAFGNLSEAAENGIDSYRELRKHTRGKGLEVHHVIEKRLKDALDISDTDSMLSVVLTKSEHLDFTKKWREAIKYGTKYKSLEPAQIWEIAQDIYHDYPALLDAAKSTIFR
jgi:hypothetical protein